MWREGKLRYGLLILFIVSQTSAATAQSVRENEAIAIGPWQIEAAYRNGKFERCLMSRTTEDGVESQLTRGADDLTLTMSSRRWQLEAGRNYAVELAAGAVSWETEVAATKNAVRVELTEPRFTDGLRIADSLEVRGAGSTIRVPLDKSAAAMERLERCYEKNSRSKETNPFVAPSRKP